MKVAPFRALTLFCLISKIFDKVEMKVAPFRALTQSIVIHGFLRVKVVEMRVAPFRALTQQICTS